MVAICQVVLRWSQEGRHQLSSNRKFTKHSWRNQLSTTILEQHVQHCRTDLLQVALCQHNIATPRHCRIGCSCNLVLYGSVRFWHLFCENSLLKIKCRFKTISSRKAKNFPQVPTGWPDSVSFQNLYFEPRRSKWKKLQTGVVQTQPTDW